MKTINPDNFVLVFSTDKKVLHNQAFVRPRKCKVSDPAVNTAYSFINPFTKEIDYNTDQLQLTEFNKNYKSRSYDAPERIKNEVSYIHQNKLNEIKSFKRNAHEYVSKMQNQMIDLFDKLAVVQKSNYTEVKSPILC
jgi:hypothetical protein